jgi:hypothetical protein
MPLIHILFRCVEYIVGVVFIERVVGEVNIATTEVVSGWLLVWLRCEPGQSLVIDVQPQRVSARQQNVDPEIELEPVDQQRVFYVLLHDVLVAIEDVFDVAREEDSSPLGKGLRLNYVSTYFSLLHTLVIVSKLTELQRNRPGLREKVVLLRVILLHGHQPQSEEVLTGQDVYSREVVDFLMQVHAKEGMGFNFPVCPPEVPVTDSLLLLHHPAQFLGDFLNDGVLGVPNVNYYLFSFRPFAQFCDWDVLGGVVRVDLDRAI